MGIFINGEMYSKEDVYTTNEIDSKLELKQNNIKIISNTTVDTSSWNNNTDISGFSYKADINVDGVTDKTFANVIFNASDSISGDYAPVCVTGENIISIYSKKNVSITIPTIIIY